MVGMRKLILSGCLAVALAAIGAGAALAEGDIMVEESWAPTTIGRSTTGVAYMTITNHGTAADRLIGASSPAAAKVELHKSVVEGGIARMLPVPTMDLKPHQPVELHPGGLHLMLTSLKAPLKAGEKIRITLKFEKSGAVDTTVTVGPAPKNAAPAAGHDHSAMPGMGH